MCSEVYGHMCNMSFAKNLAENLKKRRGKMSQDNFARKIGVSNATVNRIENQAQNTTLSTLQQIAKALKCSAGDLLD